MDTDIIGLMQVENNGTNKMDVDIDSQDHSMIPSYSCIKLQKGCINNKQHQASIEQQLQFNPSFVACNQISPSKRYQSQPVF
eukprot:1326139-Ditylum_brightwellii.AAC.1